MCNRFALTTPVDAMRQLFDIRPGLDRLGNAEPLRAIYPKNPSPVVRLTDGGEREMLNMNWGFLLPQVSKKTGKPIQPKAVNNARDDKVRTSRFWRASFEQRRCLVPASSFCEAKGRNPATYFWFAVGPEGAPEPFAFAGLWRGHGEGEWSEILSSTIVTTTPNDLVRPVHPSRMPVILRPEDYEQWLGGTPDEAAKLMRPYEAGGMHILGFGVEMKSEPGAA